MHVLCLHNSVAVVENCAKRSARVPLDNIRLRSANIPVVTFLTPTSEKTQFNQLPNKKTQFKRIPKWFLQNLRIQPLNNIRLRSAKIPVVTFLTPTVVKYSCIANTMCASGTNDMSDS